MLLFIVLSYPVKNYINEVKDIIYFQLKTATFDEKVE